MIQIRNIAFHNINNSTKIDLNYKDLKRNNILHLAIQNNNNLVVQNILKKDKNIILKLINEKNIYGETPLDIAQKKENKLIIQLIEKFYISNQKEKQTSIENKKQSIFYSYLPKGLMNIHGSCYLNSILQCLFHLEPLSLFFLKEKNNFYNNSLCKSYSSLVSGLLNQNYNQFLPIEIKKALCDINQNFYSFGNDPKDVLLDFIYNINKELLGEELSFKLTNKINKTEKVELFNYYKNEFKRSKTKITELFGWFKQIERTCLYCTKITYDFIIDTNFIFNLK
jgi:ubiquitin C-terminal hydrolase